MEYEQQFSNLIYEYLLNRLQFGYYRCGDSLPTIDVFCREFNVSEHTIWSALRRLRAEGYIDMKNGRMTKVIFEQTEQEQSNFIIDYFSKRWQAYDDLYRTTELIYIPLMVEGLRRMNDEEITYICQLSKRARADDIILFYCYTLQKMENPLLLNLFWETSLFLGYPFAKSGRHPFQYDEEAGQQRLQTMVSLIKEGSWEIVRETLIQYQRSHIGTIIECMGPKIRVVPEEERIPFIWRVYRDRPQICYNLASRLLHEIYLGEYGKTKYLPSYEKAAAEYGVSVSTMRRTVRMLNQIGAAQSINGKGTRVFTIGEQCNWPDFTSPIVRRSLSYFIQSFELLLYTCEDVSDSFIQSLHADEREELVQKLEKDRCDGHSELAIWTYLLFIIKHSRLPALREIYATTYSFFLWGYPLKAAIGSVTDTERRGKKLADSMIRHMKENNPKQFTGAIKEYIHEQFPDGKRFLEQNGIEMEELRLAPALRMMVLNE
ncbi:GntR family transcriptional regulator [Clostridium sp. MCC353]|uniref:GntR family transcriptional regulator n=1 Tax=Clostridium sp. MCC353 TaxID=2592646 RepID=UPI001C00D41C|nr:GntR family transcriptional regulator [Clostridium sp. MCC353]MBT9776951.1 GntR family transcriptional regulator [Clostridium sp. MCC353]